MRCVSAALTILLGLLVVTGGCYFSTRGDKSGGENVADIQTLLDNSAIEDSTPLTQIVAISECTRKGKSCLRFRDLTLSCTISRDDKFVKDFVINTIFKASRNVLTFFKSHIDINSAILWGNNKLTVGDIEKLSPRLYLNCSNSIYYNPELHGADESLFYKKSIELNKTVLNKGACYLPMWSFAAGDIASKLKVGRCDEITDDKYKSSKNRIEITFHKLKS